MSDAMKVAAIAETKLNQVKRYLSKAEKPKVQQILNEKVPNKQIANKVHQMNLRARSAESDKQMQNDLDELVNAFQRTTINDVDKLPLEALDPKNVIRAQKNLKLMTNKEEIQKVKDAKALQSKFPPTIVAAR